MQPAAAAGYGRQQTLLSRAVRCVLLRLFHSLLPSHAERSDSCRRMCKAKIAPIIMHAKKGIVRTHSYTETDARTPTDKYAYADTHIRQETRKQGLAYTNKHKNTNTNTTFYTYTHNDAHKPAWQCTHLKCDQWREVLRRPSGEPVVHVACEVKPRVGTRRLCCSCCRI